MQCFSKNKPQHQEILMHWSGPEHHEDSETLGFNLDQCRRQHQHDQQLDCHNQHDQNYQ